MNQSNYRRRSAADDPNSSPLFILVAIIATIAALYFAKAILLPLALAILLSFLLAPLADRLERWRIPRVVAVLGIVLMMVLLFVGVGSIVTYQLVDLSTQFKDHQGTLIKKIESVRPDSEWYAKISQSFTDLSNALAGKKTDSATPPLRVDDKAVDVKVVELPESMLAQVKAWLGPLVEPTATLGLVIVLVLFMLLDRENQRTRVVQLFGRTHLHAATEAVHDVAKRVGRYLRMLFLVNASYGLAIAIGLWVIGVPGAIMWGVLGFSLRFLPYIGPWIGALLPIMVSIATSPGWTQPMLVAGWYIFVELISNNVIEPWLYGNTIGISTVGVVITAIFWTWLWGPIGLILAMPMTVCLVVTARYVPQLRFITVLLSDQPTQSASERVYQRLLAFDFHEPLKLARAHLKESSLVKYYDDVLLPALAMAEQDRHSGLLNEEQAAFVKEAADDLVGDLGDAAITARHSGTNTEEKESATVDDTAGKTVFTARVMCIPLRDDADETVSRMLAQLLIAEGFPVVTAAAESLTAEVVDRVGAIDADVVVISILPPIGPRDSRLLWKRLRSHYPNLPIVVGYWRGANTADAIPVNEPDDHVSRIATTLAEAVNHVRAIAAQRQQIAKTG